MAPKSVAPLPHPSERRYLFICDEPVIRDALIGYRLTYHKNVMVSEFAFLRVSTDDAIAMTFDIIKSRHYPGKFADTAEFAYLKEVCPSIEYTIGVVTNGGGLRVPDTKDVAKLMLLWGPKADPEGYWSGR